METQTTDTSNSVSNRENEESEISRQNIDRLAGHTYEETPEVSEEPLVDSSELISSDRKIENNKWIQALTTLVIAGCFGLIAWFCFSLYGNVMGEKKVVTQESTTEVKSPEINEQESREDRLQAELAFSKQDEDWEPVESEISLEQPTASVSNSPQPQPVSQPVAPVSQEKPLSVASETEPQIDPLDRWVLLASLGTAVGSSDSVNLSETNSLSEAQTNSSTRNRSRSTTVEDTPTNPPPLPKPNNLGIDREPAPYGGTEVAKIAHVSIGRQEQPTKTKNQLDPDIDRFLSDAPSTNSYLERKKAQYRLKDRRIAKTAVTPISEEKLVPLGATISGEISSGIVWSEGLDPSQTRATVHLDEPLIAADGSIALQANSTLIVEVNSIDNSGLVQLSAIAISYTDKSGKLQQQLIPSGAVSIRGKDNQALIAERVNSSGSINLGQDLLLGLLGAGERGFEVLNEPDETFSNSIFDNFDADDDFDNAFPSTFTRRTNNNGSLITGAAEGAFSTTKQRLEDRSYQIDLDRQQETPIYRLERGTPVTIFVNSILNIH